jgi:type IV pilus assembly protein PilX
MNPYCAIGGYARRASIGAVGGAHHHQRGVALVVALVVLLILTILGVSALVSTALEGMMAGNVQEQNRAFQAAEAGIDDAIANPNSYIASPPTQVTGSLSGVGNYNARASYTNTFLAFSNPRRSQVGWGSHVSHAHFQTVSVGTANIGATTTLTQGLYLISPSAE